MSHSKPVDKNKKIIEGQIFFTLIKIVEQYPQYTVSQHLAHLLRKKGDREDNYYWSDDKLLKKIEDYKDELDGELALHPFREGE